MTVEEAKNLLNQYLINNYMDKLGNRYSSISVALNLFMDHLGQVIVETGTTRILGNMGGDGHFSLVASDVARFVNGQLHTVDINPEYIEVCKFVTERNKDFVRYHASDSVEFLHNFAQRIDLLYLDSMDFITTGDPNPPQDHAVKEYEAAKNKLHDKSIIVIDDVALPHGGKAGKLLPILQSDGWRIRFLGYQVVFSK